MAANPVGYKLPWVYYYSTTDVSYEDGRDNCRLSDGCCWCGNCLIKHGDGPWAVGNAAFCNGCDAQFRIDGFY